jgi:hypothetical protein
MAPAHACTAAAQESLCPPTQTHTGPRACVCCIHQHVCLPHRGSVVRRDAPHVKCLGQGVPQPHSMAHKVSTTHIHVMRCSQQSVKGQGGEGTRTGGLLSVLKQLSSRGWQHAGRVPTASKASSLNRQQAAGSCKLTLSPGRLCCLSNRLAPSAGPGIVRVLHAGGTKEGGQQMSTGTLSGVCKRQEDVVTCGCWARPPECHVLGSSLADSPPGQKPAYVERTEQAP